MQTLPAVVLALYTRRLHRWGLLAGWAVGMAAGTGLVAANSFVSVVPLSIAGMELQVYGALLALALDLGVAAAPAASSSVPVESRPRGAPRRSRSGVSTDATARFSPSASSAP